MNAQGLPVWLDLILRSLPPLLVVGGWAVVYQLQGLQARRKLLREEADKMRAAVHDLHQLAADFHTHAYSEHDRLKVLRAMTDLDRRREMLPRIARSKKIVFWQVSPIADVSDVSLDPRLIVSLNQAITGEHFDDPGAEPLPGDAEQLRRIGDSCAALVLAIDQALIAALD